MTTLASLHPQTPIWFFYHDSLLVRCDSNNVTANNDHATHTQNGALAHQSPILPTLGEINHEQFAIEKYFILTHPHHGSVLVATMHNDHSSADYFYQKLRPVLQILNRFDAQFTGKAYQIVHWHRTHRYCGQCGAPMQASHTEWMMRCIQCELDFYPRISPVGMVLIRREHEILLARSPHFPAGRFSALAGFLEPGESVEDACIREVKEEVGISIKNLRYFGSQSWPFPHSLMIAFHADYAAGDIVIDNKEIVAADWFHTDNLPDLPLPISIARQLIEAGLQLIRST